MKVIYKCHKLGFWPQDHPFEIKSLVLALTICLSAGSIASHVFTLHLCYDRPLLLLGSGPLHMSLLFGMPLHLTFFKFHHLCSPSVASVLMILMSYKVFPLYMIAHVCMHVCTHTHTGPCIICVHAWCFPPGISPMERFFPTHFPL